MRACLILSVLLLSACSTPTQQNDPVVVANKLFEAFNRHEWKKMAALYSDSALFLDPSFGTAFVRKSREQTIAKYVEMHNMFPNLHDEVVNMFPSGETVTIEFISTGTSPGGVKFCLPIVSILTIKNGQVIKDATYYDL